jgi:hypothetical protein
MSVFFFLKQFLFAPFVLFVTVATLERSLSNRTIVWIAIFPILILCGGVLWHFFGRDDGKVVTTRSDAVAAAKDSRLNQTVFSLGSAPARNSMLPTSADAQNNRTPLYAVFVDSTDFAQTLRDLLAQVSNPEASYLASQIIRRCANVWLPESLDRQRKSIGTELAGDLARRRVKALDAEIYRCRNMTKADFIVPFQDLIKRAALAGDPKALARELGVENAKSDEDDLSAAKAAQRLASLRDPLVIQNLSAYFDTRDSSHRWPLESSMDLVSGKDLGMAWRLAACEYGADCSMQSEELVALCVHKGQCNAEDRVSLYSRYAATPEQFARVLQLRQMILVGLATNQWPPGMWQGGVANRLGP